MTRDRIVDVITRWEKAFADRDLETYASLYSDRAVMESPLAGSVCGREAVTKAVLGLLSAFPDSKFESEEPVIDGSRATIAASVTGTHAGSLLGLAPTGRPFRFTLVFLLDFKDDLIVRDRRVYDFTGLLVQLGVLKAKPAH